MSLHSYVVGLFAAVSLLAGGSVLAQGYPNQSVKIILPLDPGNGTDLAARILADELTKELKQPFVVQNVPGAAQLRGAQVASTSAPDGYTLFFAVGNTIQLARYALAGVDFDLVRDLTPIAKVVTSNQMMIVSSKVPANNPTELIAYIKQNPKDFNWGTSGKATPSGLAVGKFNRMAGIDPLVVPYASTSAIVAALLQGDITGSFTDIATPQALIEAGKLKPIGMATLEPDDRMPNLRTIASYGFPGFVSNSYYGFWGPKGMPAALASQINGYVVKAMAVQDVKDKMAARAIPLDKTTMSAAEFAAYINNVEDSTRTMVTEMGIRPE